MLLIRFPTLGALPLAAALIAPPTHAQCPKWAEGMRTEFGGTPDVFGTFDGGEGPEMILAGSFSTAGDTVAANIVRWNGTRFAPLGAGLDGRVFALAVFDDGSGPALYAGGQFTEAGSVAASNVARWDGSAWSPLGAGIGTGIATAVKFLGVVGGQLVAIGNFTTAGGLAATGFAVWDGTSWSVPSDGLDGFDLRDVETFDDGQGQKLYVAGVFSMAGGVAASNLAAWDGTSWSAAGDPDSAVSALAVFDDGLGGGPALYASGSFTTIGGVMADGVARWDGTAWVDQSFSIEFAPQDLAVYDDGGAPTCTASRSRAPRTP